MWASNRMQGLHLWITFLTLALPPGIQTVCRSAKKVICGPLWRFLKWLSPKSNWASADDFGIIMGNFLSTLYWEFARRPPTRLTLLSWSKNGERLSRWPFALIRWLDDSTGRLSWVFWCSCSFYIPEFRQKKLQPDSVMGYSRWVGIWWGSWWQTSICLFAVMCCFSFLTVDRRLVGGD